MIRLTCTLSLLSLLFACTEKQPADYVDTFIGTGYHGHTYPGATTPNGAVQLSPDTRADNWDACSGYHYSDSTIDGFSHTHLSGTGCADLADVMFYPATQAIAVENGAAVLPAHNFSHSEEMSTAGYYQVELPDAQINVELTATPRCGVHRYSFSSGDSRSIVIDMLHTVAPETINETDLKQLSDNEVVGMRSTTGWVADQRIHFAAKFSEKIVKSEILNNNQIIIHFNKDIKSLIAKVGLSIVSVENAQENLATEVVGFDFDAVRTSTEQIWANDLSVITVKGGSSDDMTTFYSAMYHTMVSPTIVNDVNGEYRRNNNDIATAAEGKNIYSTLSLWDTFRAWHPLQTLINKELVNDIVISMLDIYDATGELPMWPLSAGETGTMIGYHSVSVIADAYLRGIKDFDADKALEAMIQSSNINKKGSDYYVEFGFIPANMKKESVSCLLEYAYDDWCIAAMAEAMGRSEVAATYFKRAENYINVFDGATGFFRGKNANGSFSPRFNEFISGRDYTEATPWQYRFFVPHDVNGMIQLFGSKDKFIAELDKLFVLENDGEDIGMVDITGLVGQYAHGNEPSHHMAYLYNYVGQPWKTQELTRKLLKQMYAPTPEGIIGNEDCGQMSAWYVLSSLGFYSVCPGSGEYALTTPLFEEATIKLTNGKSLCIKANSPNDNIYIDKVELNGKVIEANFITYDQLMEGGELLFTLVSTPNMERGTATENYPHSMSEGESVSIPYTTSQVALFENEVVMDLATTTDGAEIRYTLNNEEPTQQSPLYTAPFELNKTTVIKAKGFIEGMAPSSTYLIVAKRAKFMTALQSNSGMKPGVKYQCYLGKFSNVEQIKGGEFDGRGVMAEPSLSEAPREDHYGYVFTGFIKIEEKGLWQFMTKSDDGSVLYIGNELVVDNNGSHAAIEATGAVALNKGYYPFTLYYFEDYEGQHLEWGWKAQSASEFTNIPTTSLFTK